VQSSRRLEIVAAGVLVVVLWVSTSADSELTRILLAVES